MSDTTEKPVGHIEPQEKQQLSMAEIHLVGEGEHTHGAPRKVLDLNEDPGLDNLDEFVKGQKEVIFFTDGHHLIQILRPEDVAKIERSPLQMVAHCSQLSCLPHPPTTPPLAPGHYRLRFQCGDTETTVDWPEEQANAYHAKFARQAGHYRRPNSGRESSYVTNAKTEKPLSHYFDDDALLGIFASV
ncbi:hypothetical protein BO99DRAFT_415145 [Aspergillus violaceofuscus CBS 115571]|uniref:Uncharacterized protein n=1 Tax=Aspergillus violaceofuscus (strain CBS 115571) TaxID=1450538 RepID=A0A2V5HJR6_ASPV1|nr:hypothetical protein BO99DRAFT_415145 [Aspergillus violaceofuscus CBS 115571]